MPKKINSYNFSLSNITKLKNNVIVGYNNKDWTFTIFNYSNGKIKEFKKKYKINKIKRKSKSSVYCLTDYSYSIFDFFHKPFEISIFCCYFIKNVIYTRKF